MQQAMPNTDHAVDSLDNLEVTTVMENQSVEPAFHPIAELLEHGFKQEEVDRLVKYGMHTLDQFYHFPEKDLIAQRAISEQKYQTLKRVVQEIIPRIFTSGTQILEQRKNISLISTGSQALNNLLGGGIETGMLTEIFGEFKTGKTQFCHTLCVTTQMSRDSGGAESRVMYIDTEQTFRPERIQDIATYYGMDATAVLDNIFVAKAYSSDHQQDLLKQASSMLASERFGLLIIDSATALFRTDYNGRGELSVRQNALGKFLRNLHILASTYGVAVVITNQVMSDVGAAAMFATGGDSKKPIGGNIMAHATTTRLQFKKGKGNQRWLKVYDSPLLPEGEAAFAISLGGIVDPDAAAYDGY